nr:phage/plasmid replication protein [uncultured Niameybacter sp.]
MIHTIQMYTSLTKREKACIERYYRKSLYFIIKEIEEIFKEHDITLNLKKFSATDTYNLYLETDVIKLLKKQDGVITEEDYSEADKIIHEIEQQLLLWELERNFILIRIDYRLDVKVENEVQRKYLFKLWNKLAAKYYHMKKCNRPKVDTAHVESVPFETTIYFNSKSICVTVYDKEQERQDKGIQAEEYEKNVLRFEVRLMNAHLKNMKSGKKREKTLEAYWKEEVYMSYMQKYVVRLFGTDPFYKIYYARKMIRTSLYPEKEQQKLETFLTDISKYGVEGVIGYRTKLEWDYKQYSRYQMRKYSRMLAQLGINMILVPQNEVAALGKIPNPLAIFRGVEMSKQ